MTNISSHVDGNELVIVDKTALPQRCVKTNRPISEPEYTTWDLPYIPTWLKILMLMAPFFMIAVPFAVRQRCRFRAGLSTSVRRRYFLLKLAAIALILLAFVLPGYGVATTNANLVLVGLVTFIPLFWGGIVLLVLFTDPLRVIQVKNELFWVRGCSVDFLESL